jgi:hypothetical protein
MADSDFDGILDEVKKADKTTRVDLKLKTKDLSKGLQNIVQKIGDFNNSLANDIMYGLDLSGNSFTGMLKNKKVESIATKWSKQTNDLSEDLSKALGRNEKYQVKNQDVLKEIAELQDKDDAVSKEKVKLLKKIKNSSEESLKIALAESANSTDTFTNFNNGLKKLTMGFVDIGSTLDAVFEFKNAVEDVAKGFYAAGAKLLSPLTKTISTIFNGLSNFATNLSKMIMDTKFMQAVSEKFGKIKDSISAFVGKIGNAISLPFKVMGNMIKGAFSKMGDFISPFTDMFKDPKKRKEEQKGAFVGPLQQIQAIQSKAVNAVIPSKDPYKEDSALQDATINATGDVIINSDGSTVFGKSSRIDELEEEMFESLNKQLEQMEEEEEQRKKVKAGMVTLIGLLAFLGTMFLAWKNENFGALASGLKYVINTAKDKFVSFADDIGSKLSALGPKMTQWFDDFGAKITQSGWFTKLMGTADNPSLISRGMSAVGNFARGVGERVANSSVGQFVQRTAGTVSDYASRGMQAVRNAGGALAKAGGWLTRRLPIIGAIIEGVVDYRKIDADYEKAKVLYEQGQLMVEDPVDSGNQRPMNASEWGEFEDAIRAAKAGSFGRAIGSISGQALAATLGLFSGGLGAAALGVGLSMGGSALGDSMATSMFGGQEAYDQMLANNNLNRDTTAEDVSASTNELNNMAASGGQSNVNVSTVQQNTNNDYSTGGGGMSIYPPTNPNPVPGN